MLPTLEAIRALNEANVRYVVVGGLATIAHGYVRLTTDADVVVALDRENAQKAVEAIISAGFVPGVPIKAADFADQETREKWIAEKNMMVLNFKMSSDVFQAIDVFVKYPLDFELMYAESQIHEGYGIPVRICSLDHLIRMKLESGRPKDMDDVRMLEMIREERA